MKTAVVFYHANTHLYNPQWISRCISSMANQTQTPDSVFELDFSGNNNKLVKNSVFFSQKIDNYADAANFIITQAFDAGADVVFNTNIDDYYHTQRIEKQLPYILQGYDIVSSDFQYIDENDTPGHIMNIKNNGDIDFCFNNGLNVIANPVVAFSSNFWNNPDNRYNKNHIPAEDFDLWKRAIKNGYTFYIHPNILLYYRIHLNKVSNTLK
jgi:hypothetical protein